MPYAAYIRQRINSRTLTVADCVELIFDSTVTHVHVPPDWVPMQHPPHAHAHFATDGFRRDVSQTEDTVRIHQLEAQERRLRTETRAELGELRQRMQDLRAQDGEGFHIDPATRTRGDLDPQRQVVDESPAPKRYIDRKLHSQFEDAESSAMALFYALKSDAGAAALGFLDGVGRRVELKSISAANALNGAPVPFHNPPRKLSHHPLRRSSIQALERGSGVPGVAPTPKAAIAVVVCVLDWKPDGRLLLITNFPKSALDHGHPPNNDMVVRKVWNPNPQPPSSPHFALYAPPQGAQQVAYPAYDALQRPNLEWSEPDAQILLAQSRSKGLACRQCGAVHGKCPSVLDLWHRCRRCQSVYCADCGKHLPSASLLSRERICNYNACFGRTALIS